MRGKAAALWLLLLACLPVQLVAATPHWVATWGCGQQLTEPRNLPPVPLANATLRQFVHNSLGGHQLRVRLSNAFGTEPVVIQAAHLALAAGAGSRGDGEINSSTDTPLRFGGKTEVVIPAGQGVYSDSLAFDLPALTNLAVSIWFGQVSATAVTGHPGSRTTSFVAAGNQVAAARLSAAAKTAHWYLLAGLEVLADPPSRALVVLGDSISDGRGSTTDGNDRWPDQLARRCATNAPTAGLAVVNMGIGGNAIFGGIGPAAVARFETDVLGQSGARYFILFEGINDLGTVRDAQAAALATKLIAAYTQFAQQVGERHIRPYAATLTPMGGSAYYTPAREAARQIVNTWIRTNRVFAGAIDFDAAVRDPAAPEKVSAAFVASPSDTLHINPAGYQAMAGTIDLQLFVP